MRALKPRVGEAAMRVLGRLRRHPLTVDELSRALRLTANAVRDQLRKLERQGLVVRAGNRPGSSKPSILYAITLEGATYFSTLYLPVLTEFLRTAEGQCGGKQLTTFMRDTGKSLGRRFPRPAGPLKARVAAAASLLNGFGGLIESAPSNGAFVMRSSACPLAVLTSKEGTACKVIEGLLAEYIDASVKTCCDNGPDPRCCFEVRR